jgi:cell division protein FtsQ
VATRGRVAAGTRPRARTASVVVPFPRPARGERLDLARLVPTGRSLGIAFAVLLGAVLAWVAARETSVFAVRTVAVAGADERLGEDVRRALRDTLGESLLAVDLAKARTAVESLPAVRAVSFDRAFPHTLEVVIRPERPVAVVRQGRDSYLLSARGRVIAAVDRRTQPALARIWVTRAVTLAPGQLVTGDLRTAVGAVTPIAGTRFPRRVTSVRVSDSDLTLRLRSGLELRLGDPHEAELKLAVARSVLPLLVPGTTYLDVSVPERPVAGTAASDPHVEVESSTSTPP